MAKNQKIPTHNDKLIIGLLIGLFIGFITFYASKFVPNFSDELLTILITILVVFAALFLVIIWFRKRIIRKFFGRDIAFQTIVKDTQETIYTVSDKITEDLPIDEEKKSKIKKFAPKLINYILWSNFRNWGLRILATFIIGLGGIVSTTLIFNQNKLLEVQNERIAQQTYLIEADRRSAQIYMMGEILSDINDELNNKTEKEKTLSNTLVGRINSLSFIMRPYKYLNSDLLIDRPLSPERAQLLITLLESDIDSVFLKKRILQRANFKNSDFSNIEAIFSNKVLDSLKLDYSDFSNSRLNNAKFSNALLQYTSFHNAFLTNTDFYNAKLYEADLSRVNSIYNANFRKANLIRANLSGLKFNNIHMEGALIDNANITNVDFSGTTYLDSVRVHRFDWIDYINSLKLKGALTVKNTYYVDSIKSTGMRKYLYYLIRKPRPIK